VGFFTEIADHVVAACTFSFSGSRCYEKFKGGGGGGGREYLQGADVASVIAFVTECLCSLCHIRYWGGFR
jgi:hypothetical protein